MRPKKSLVRDLLLALDRQLPVHFELENLLDFVEAHSYSHDQVISALEYLKHEGYLSGLILYDDQGQPYHFIIDGMSRQGLDLLDSLSKESTL
jgi:hypothetical protein